MTQVDVQAHIQLKNILFATDFSRASESAVPFATELASRSNAKIYALHVRPRAIKPTLPQETWKDQDMSHEMEMEVERIKQLLRTSQGIQAEILVKEGDVWANVLNIIVEHDIDLVVIGTRGRTGISKLLLGSVAEEIFRKSPCPVLTIGPHLSTQPEQFGKITRIIFCTDFSPESLGAVPYAFYMAKQYQANLTMLHVARVSEPHHLVHPSDLKSTFLQLFHKHLPFGDELWSVAEYVLEYGEVAEKILEVAIEKGAGLIVLGVRHASGFPGAATHLGIATAHKIVSHATCPVLTVRA